MSRTTRWLRIIVAVVAAVFPQDTGAVTCLDSGCTYQDLGCTYNRVWKDIDCKHLGIQGRIYIDNIPNDAKYVFLKGNPAMTSVDPRSYETNNALFLLDASCAARGCTYESLRCDWNHANKMLNCGNRAIVGEVFLTNIPKGVKILRLENNLITKINPLTFYQKHETQYFGGLITGVQGVGPHDTLLEFYASSNQLTAIQPTLFRGVPSVTTIDLAGNQIARIDDRSTFENYTLSILNMKQNVDKTTRCTDLDRGCSWWAFGCTYSLRQLDCTKLGLSGTFYAVGIPWDMDTLKTEHNHLDSIDARAIVARGGTAALTRDATTSMGCLPDLGCGWVDINCQWYNDLKQMSCEARHLTGHLFINDLPQDIHALFISGNAEKLTYFDPRSLAGRAQFQQLTIDRGTRLGCMPAPAGCKYETLNCAYDAPSKSLDCSRRNLTGPVSINNVPDDCEYLDLSHNHLTTLDRLTTLGKTALQIVRLENNDITYLDQSMFHGLFLTNVYLVGNPIDHVSRQCPPGTGQEENSVKFAQAPRVKTWYNCPACEAYCAECNSFQTCTRCKPNYFLRSGDCFPINEPRSTSPIETMGGDYYPRYEEYENYPGPYATVRETPPRILPFDKAPTDDLGYTSMGQRKLYPVKFSKYLARDWGSVECAPDTVPVDSLRGCETAYKAYIDACPTFYRGQGEHPRVIAEYDPFASLTTLGDYNGKIDANAIGIERAGALRQAQEQRTVRILPEPRHEGPSGCYVQANQTTLVFRFNPVLAHKLQFVEEQGYLIDFDSMEPIRDASPICMPKRQLSKEFVVTVDVPACFLNGSPLNVETRSDASVKAAS